MSDDFHSKLSHLVSELHSLVQSSSTNDQGDGNEAEHMPEGPDEGDPSTDDNAEPEGDSEPFAHGAHDKHVGAESDGDFGASKESHMAGGEPDDKEGKKSMLLALLKKHG